MSNGQHNLNSGGLIVWPELVKSLVAGLRAYLECLLVKSVTNLSAGLNGSFKHWKGRIMSIICPSSSNDWRDSKFISSLLLNCQLHWFCSVLHSHSLPLTIFHLFTHNCKTHNFCFLHFMCVTYFLKMLENYMQPEKSLTSQQLEHQYRES